MFVNVDQFTVNFDHLDMLRMKVDREVLTVQETGLSDLAIQQIWDPRDTRREKAPQVLRLKQLTQSK